MLSRRMPAFGSAFVPHHCLRRIGRDAPAKRKATTGDELSPQVAGLSNLEDELGARRFVFRDAVATNQRHAVAVAAFVIAVLGGFAEPLRSLHCIAWHTIAIGIAQTEFALCCGIAGFGGGLQFRNAACAAAGKQQRQAEDQRSARQCFTQ